MPTIKRKVVTNKDLEAEKEKRLQEKMKALREKALEREAKGISQISKIPYIDLKGFPIEKTALLLITKEQAEKSETIPFYTKENKVRLGIANVSNPEAKDIITFLRDKDYEVNTYIISQNSFNYALNYYDKVIVTKKTIEKVEIGEEALDRAKKMIKSLADLRSVIRKVSTTEVINIIFAGALLSDASDIHIEPEEEDVILRYRIDGVLQEITRISQKNYPKVLSRIKYLAKLKINITDVPQDGRFTITLEGKEIDIRVSTLPTGYGETIVMRLLGMGAIELKLDDLGFRKRDLDLLRREISKPTGLILTTGPTGSGKTTTLYSCLNEVKTPAVKIITLENPIEYRLEGIVQTQIDAAADMTFAKGLRAILRQDPDVVMVGEIRDLETADIAAQAALTGHIVFSTLHTNDASGAIPRLINMGVRPYVIGPSLSLVIGQRLVRKLCKSCRQAYGVDKELEAELKGKLGKNYPKEKIKEIYKANPKGCDKCHETGYSGRIGIYEMFYVDDNIEALINQRASSLEILNTAKKQGMMTMEQDGLLKVIEGVTDLSEVKRVVD